MSLGNTTPVEGHDGILVIRGSDTDPVMAVVARSDPSEWEHIVAYDREKEAVSD